MRLVKGKYTLVKGKIRQLELLLNEFDYYVKAQTVSSISIEDNMNLTDRAVMFIDYDAARSVTVYVLETRYDEPTVLGKTFAQAFNPLVTYLGPL